MKHFKLIEIDNDTNDNNINASDDDDDDDDDYDDAKYNDIKQSKQEPVVSTVEKKRSNKTEQCPKCLKFCNKKTMLYAHKCKAKTVQPTQQPTQSAQPTQQTPAQPPQQTPAQPPPEQPQPAPAQQLIPTEQDIHNYILNQQKQRMQQLREQKQARFNNLISRAF